jgi:hypothetical protein
MVRAIVIGGDGGRWSCRIDALGSPPTGVATALLSSAETGESLG